MKCKLRHYYITGEEKGNLKYEEYFETSDEMWKKYRQVFEKGLRMLNPTGWEIDEDGEWTRVI